MNQDAMANEKLAEGESVVEIEFGMIWYRESHTKFSHLLAGIRKFAADLDKLEGIVKSKL